MFLLPKSQLKLSSKISLNASEMGVEKSKLVALLARANMQMFLSSELHLKYTRKFISSGFHFSKLRKIFNS